MKNKKSCKHNDAPCQSNPRHTGCLLFDSRLNLCHPHSSLKMFVKCPLIGSFFLFLMLHNVLVDLPGRSSRASQPKEKTGNIDPRPDTKTSGQPAAYKNTEKKRGCQGQSQLGKHRKRTHGMGPSLHMCDPPVISCVPKFFWLPIGLFLCTPCHIAQIPLAYFSISDTVFLVMSLLSLYNMSELYSIPMDLSMAFREFLNFL